MGALPPYRAPRWLPGPHAQTIWPALFAPRPPVLFERSTWDTPDGDFVEIDEAVGPRRAHDAAAPLLVLFHGLEGGSRSHYARALSAAALVRGWRAVVVHFRGCGGSPNRMPRAYHSGDSEEVDWVLARMRDTRARGAPIFAVGVSLGGNVLLKWLGERGRAAMHVQAAVAVSPPQDLQAGADALARGFNRVYTRNFLATLKRKSLGMLERHPGLVDADRVAAARTLAEFDDVVTAPLHGFADARDYYRRASCKQYLPGITVPTLVVNARNDPFLPAAALAGPGEASAAVTLCYPEEGGHVGFATGAPPGRLDWLPAAVFGFFGAPAAGAPSSDPSGDRN